MNHQEIKQVLDKATTQRYKDLVKLAKMLANEQFHDAIDYDELLKMIVSYKRLARLSLRGDLASEVKES